MSMGIVAISTLLCPWAHHPRTSIFLFFNMMASAIGSSSVDTLTWTSMHSIRPHLVGERPRNQGSCIPRMSIMLNPAAHAPTTSIS